MTDTDEAQRRRGEAARLAVTERSSSTAGRSEQRWQQVYTIITLFVASLAMFFTGWQAYLINQGNLFANRAWLSPDDITFDENFIDKEQAILHLGYKNIGKTPASNVIVLGDFRVLAIKAKDATMRSPVELFQVDCSIGRTRTLERWQTVFPEQDHGLDSLLSISYSKGDVADIRKALLALAVET